MSKPPVAAQFMIVDRDHELTVGVLDNVLVCHWKGPHDARNGRRVERAMRDAALQGPFAVVTVIEASSAPPDTAERARLTSAVRDLPLVVVAAVVRGNPVRRTLMTMVLTAMLFLMRNELASKLAFCADEQEAARWVASNLPRGPSAATLVDILESLS